MTTQDKKIIMCFRWLLRLKRIGASDNEIIKALECILEHGEGIEIIQMELEIEKAIEYRGTIEYLNEQHLKSKEINKKVRQLEKLAESLMKKEHQEANNGET